MLICPLGEECDNDFNCVHAKPHECFNSDGEACNEDEECVNVSCGWQEETHKRFNIVCIDEFLYHINKAVKNGNMS